MTITKIFSILCFAFFIALIANWQTDEVYLWTIGGILAIIAQTFNYIGRGRSGDKPYQSMARAPIVIVGLLMIAFIAINISMYILIITVYLFWIMVITGWIVDYIVWKRLC